MLDAARTARRYRHDNMLICMQLISQAGLLNNNQASQSKATRTPASHRLRLPCAATTAAASNPWHVPHHHGPLAGTPSQTRTDQSMKHALQQCTSARPTRKQHTDSTQRPTTPNDTGAMDRCCLGRCFQVTLCCPAPCHCLHSRRRPHSMPLPAGPLQALPPPGYGCLSAWPRRMPPLLALP